MSNFLPSRRQFGNSLNGRQQSILNGSGPNAKLLSAGGKRPTKNWNFETLEPRQMMAGDLIVPNDTYFTQQWGLLNTGGPNIGDQILQDIRGTAGEDINILGAWNQGVTGEGITIGVVGYGIQTNHPDLAANISPTLGYDARLDQSRATNPNAGEANLSIAAEAEDTAIAGLIGAVGNNNRGIIGVAHESTLVPIKVYDGFQDSSDFIASQTLQNAILYQNQEIDIYNHNWGPSDRNLTVTSPTVNEIIALRESVRVGRGGLGVIHVFAAGDGAGAGVGRFNTPAEILSSDFAGYNGYINSRFTIGVTAVDHDGEAANVDGTITRYQEIGPSVLVAAPSGSFSGFGVIDDPTVGSGIWTTDFAPTPGPISQFQQGYNAPTTPNGLETNDLLIDPFTGLTLNDRLADPAYTSRFSGTAAASALVSGVVALMLEADIEANGEATLSYRDVQEILVRSARQTAVDETLLTGGQMNGPNPITYPSTWITNRNEVFHTPGFFDTVAVFTVDDEGVPLEDEDGDRIPSGTFFPVGHPGMPTSIPLVSQFDYLYNPVLQPDEHNASLFTNGAGYTVSQGRTFQGTEIGYAHGVVDAELAVSMAANWNRQGQNLVDEQTYTTFPLPVGLNLPARSIGSDDTGDIYVPSRPGAPDDFIRTINEYVTDDPFEDPNEFPFPSLGVPIEFSVPEDQNMSVEWVEAKIQLSTGDISNIRITLVSPEGVHSELSHFFDTVQGTQTPQHFGDVVNFAGEVDSLAGDGIGGNVDPTGGGLFYTFSTNRNWGERATDAIKYDPATGEPYLLGFQTDDEGEFVPVAATGNWQLLLENHGTTGAVVESLEVAWHGTPIQEGTQRISGKIGLDQNQDDIFNFERYQQFYTEIVPSYDIVEIEIPNPDFDPENPDPEEPEFLITQNAVQAPRLEFDRLGEVERLADPNQEEFAANTTVELYARDAAGVETLIDQFITGDDGNFYFDVIPPEAFDATRQTDFNIDLNFTTPIDPELRLEFQRAARRWENIITADLPDVMDPLFGQVVDDLVVDIAFEPIDGPSGILGSAGPSAFRTDSLLPFRGGMTIDSDDYQFDTAGLADVVAHEIGHILGFGTLWEDFGYLEGSLAGGGTNPQYTGPLAVAEYNLVFGETGDSVPVSNVGAPNDGSTDSHWRELIFGNELMSPFYNAGEVNPISSITVAALEDLGYTVDYSQAEPYSPPTSGSGGNVGEQSFGRGQFISEIQDRRYVDPLPAGSGDNQGGAGGNEPLVAYVVRVSDAEGRAPKVDPNAPAGFLPKYQTEWVLDSNYFAAADHFGRAPEYVVDGDGNFVFDDITMEPLIIGDFVFDPATEYDIAADLDGRPVPLQPLGFGGPEDILRADANGINFLLDLPVAQQSPDYNMVTLEGQVYNDSNGSRTFDSGDVALGNVEVFADLNNDGAFNPGEPSVFTVANGPDQGNWSLTFETDTIQFFQVGVVRPTGFNYSQPQNGLLGAIVQPGDGTLSGFDFGLVFNGNTNPNPNPNPDPDPDPGTNPSTIPGRIGGVVFEDLNANGSQQANELGVPGITVYIDENGNSQLDSDEQFTVTNQFGRYDISMVPPGVKTVRIIAALPFDQVTPINDQGRVFTLVPNGNRQGISFGVKNLADRDYGDLLGYPTLASENGPSHKIQSSVFLGTNIDGELDGQPNASATGDDFDADPQDDEDGVVGRFGADGIITAGESLSFDIFVNGVGASLNAWIDFNNDGDWTDPGEQIFTNVAVNPGMNTTGNANPALRLPAVTAPANTASGVPLAARFRLGAIGLSFVGPADTGEVEDYLFNVPVVDPGSTAIGDYDGNGTVERADYDVWKASFGLSGPGIAADGNGDGFVNAADYTIWRDNLGASATAGGSGGGSGAFQEELQRSYAASATVTSEVDTGVGSHNFDSVLASLGLRQTTAELGSGANTETVTLLQTAPGVDPAQLNVAAISELLEAIGSGPTEGLGSTGNDDSTAVAAAVADNLDLALADVTTELDEEDPIERVTNPDDQADTEVEALDLALEEGWTAV